MMTITPSMLTLLLATTASAFVGPSPTFRKPTRVFLEDHIADMVDQELYRQQHKKEFEREWMEKNRGAIFRQLNDKDNLMEEEPEQNFRQMAKDRKMAKDDPARYCADRCVSTGNCDVYEDIFKFSPDEVMEFCNDCVLSEDEEPCDIPDTFYDVDELKP